MRSTKHLRAAYRSRQTPYSTRQRFNAVLDRFDSQATPHTTAGMVLEHLIAIAEEACACEDGTMPDADWAIGAIERHLTRNADL